MTEIGTIKYKISRFFCKSIIMTFEKMSKKYVVTEMPLFDQELRDNVDTIREEFVNYYKHYVIPSAGEVSKEQLKIEDKKRWKTLVLKLFGYTNKVCEELPTVYNILKKHNNIMSALFSVMEPSTHIKPHRGVFNGVVRYHLGIIVPKSNEVYIKIENKKRYWREGESFIFDDTLLHEAVNKSKRKRVVLIIDFKRPLPWYLDMVNRLILKIINKSPLIQNIVENLENLTKKP